MCVLRERHHHGQKYSQRGRQAVGTRTHGPASACSEMSIADWFSPRMSALAQRACCIRPYSAALAVPAPRTRTARGVCTLAPHPRHEVGVLNHFHQSIFRCITTESAARAREAALADAEARVDPENLLGAFSAPSRSLLGTFSEPSRRVPTPPPSPPWPPTRSTRASLRGAPGMREV